MSALRDDAPPSYSAVTEGQGWLVEGEGGEALVVVAVHNGYFFFITL